MKLKRAKNRILEWLQYIFFRAVCFLVNLIPFFFALELGKWGGRLLYFILPKFREVAVENLRLAFPGKTEKEIKKIAVESFENLGLFAVEFIRIPKIVRRLNQYIVINNQESVYRALEAGKGLVLIVSHFGNWEWMAVASGVRAREEGIKISAVARTLGNPFLYRYVIEHLRGITGLKTIDKKGASREVIKRLEQNEIVCILVDQHEQRGSVPVPYFGRPAWTTSLPAVLALKKGAAVIPVFSFREKNRPMRIELGGPFPLIKTGNYEQDLIENTAQYIRTIEEVVRKRPADWLWMHARWRAHRTEKVR